MESGAITERPRPDGSDIRKMSPDEVAPVAHALAEAFFNDPHFSWIIREDAQRLERLERGFALFTSRVWLPHDEAFTHDSHLGAALWMPPGTWHLGVFAQLRLLPGLISRMRGDSGRLLKALTFIERRHPREPDHWYLPLIGVTPSWQGRGFGAALLRPMLERCDAERTPAYLEASSPRNRALYERHGFEVMDECRYAEDGPPLWRMWRDPRPEPAV